MKTKSYHSVQVSTLKKNDVVRMAGWDYRLTQKRTVVGDVVNLYLQGHGVKTCYTVLTTDFVLTTI